MKKQTPLLPIIIAGVIAGIVAIPLNGSNAETMFVVPLAAMGVGFFARQRTLREMQNPGRR